MNRYLSVSPSTPLYPPYGRSFHFAIVARHCGGDRRQQCRGKQQGIATDYKDEQKRATIYLLLRFHSNTRSGDFHFFFYLLWEDNYRGRLKLYLFLNFSHHPAVANSFLFRNLSHHPADPFLCSSCDFSRMSFARKCTPFPHCSFIHRRMTRSCSRTVEERVAAVAVVAVGGGATSSQVCPLLDISVAALASACRLWRCW